MPTSIDNEKASQLGDATTAAAAAERANAGHHLTPGQFVTRRVLPTVGLLGVAALAAACGEVAVSAARDATPGATDTAGAQKNESLDQIETAIIQSNLAKYPQVINNLVNFERWQSTQGQGVLDRPGSYTINDQGLFNGEIYVAGAKVVNVEGQPTLQITAVMQDKKGNPYVAIINGQSALSKFGNFYDFLSHVGNFTYDQGGVIFIPSLQDEANVINTKIAGHLAVIGLSQTDQAKDMAAFKFLNGTSDTLPNSLTPLAQANTPTTSNTLYARTLTFADSNYPSDPSTVPPTPTPSS